MKQMFGGDAPHPQDAGELFAALESTEGVNTDAETEIDAVTSPPFASVPSGGSCDTAAAAAAARHHRLQR